MSDLEKVKKHDRGAILVFTVIIMVVLIGMAALAIDIGQMYVAKQRAQNVCDAAAQAGVRELATEARTRSFSSGGVSTARAVQAANQCTVTNNSLVPSWKVLIADDVPGDDLEGVKITFPLVETILNTDSGQQITVKYTGQAIRTEGYVNVDCAFAGIFGMYNKDIHAQATAIVSSKFCSKLIIPLTGSKLTIGDDGEMPDIQGYVLYTLHAGSWQEGDLGPGNYLSLRLPGEDLDTENGKKRYRERLAGKEEICMDEGTSNWDADTEPGDAAMQTFKGLEARLTDSEYQFDKDFPYVSPTGQDDYSEQIESGSIAWTKWLESGETDGDYDDTMRLAIIPLLGDMTGATGMTHVKIAGFAGFFIRNFYQKDTVDADGTEHKAGDVQGYFVWATIVGSGDFEWYVEPGSAPPAMPELMILTYRLIS